MDFWNVIIMIIIFDFLDMITYYTVIILIQSKTPIYDMWPYIIFPVLYIM